MDFVEKQFDISVTNGATWKIIVSVRQMCDDISSVKPFRIKWRRYVRAKGSIIS
jgi:hypothetical protein